MGRPHDAGFRLIAGCSGKTRHLAHGLHLTTDSVSIWSRALARVEHLHLAENPMKKIEAVIRHHKVEEVKTALVEKGFQGLTITEVRGFGRQKGHSETYRGAEYKVDFVPKIKVELVVTSSDCDSALETLTAAARTGQIGDGKVFVSELQDVVRIRTGETGKDAV